jgi:hypothetical protein
MSGIMADIEETIIMTPKEYKQTHPPICERCGESSQGLHVHHKDQNHDNNEETNLELLCASCHSKHHSKDIKNKPVPKMEINKLQCNNLNIYHITVPIPFIRELGWKKGDQIKMVRGDGELVLRKLG